MLGPLPFVSVRQEHDEGAGTLPFGFGRRNELVDDDLSSVGEVSELRFPHAEHFRVIERVTVVEPEDGGFAQQAVVDAELGLAFFEMVERHIVDALLGVVECGMPLAEGAAAAVLSGEADRSALDEQRTKRERFGKRPVVRSAIAQDFKTAVNEHAPHFRQNMEIRRNTAESLDDFAQHGGTDLGMDRIVGIRGLENGGGSGEASAFPAFALGFFDDIERFLEVG